MLTFLKNVVFAQRRKTCLFAHCSALSKLSVVYQSRPHLAEWVSPLRTIKGEEVFFRCERAHFLSQKLKIFENFDVSTRT